MGTLSEDLLPFADVPVEIEAELEQRALPASEVLDWAEGGLIGAVWPAEDRIRLSIGGALVAWGELAPDGRALGVRITELVSEA